MRMSALEESVLNACFHGIENSVRSAFVHWTPGYLPLSMRARSHGMSRGLEWDIPAKPRQSVTSAVSFYWFALIMVIYCTYYDIYKMQKSTQKSLKCTLHCVHQWERKNQRFYIKKPDFKHYNYSSIYSFIVIRLPLMIMWLLLHD